VTVPDGGTLTPKGDVRAFAEALLAWCSHPERAAAAGHYNRADAVNRFSWAVSAANMLAVYQRVVDRFADQQGAPIAAVAS
jgi:glycosyltransferase involved in cell wall biosynthesis